MTTPPREMTAVGVFGILAIGVVLLTGALRVPVPEVPALWQFATQLRSTLPTPQGGLDALPPPRIVADPDRQWIPFVDRASGTSEIRETMPVGRWFPLSSDGRTGIVPVPWFPGGSRGLWPPRSEAELRQLTRVPLILNPDEILRAVEEAYPTRLREQRIGGTVGVQFLVEPVGVVQQRRIGQASAYRDLDEAALRVARVYRFLPADLDGEAVAVWVSHAIDFRVE